MNDPFDYSPHPLCETAVADMLAQPWPEAFAREMANGKMMGVLIVTDDRDQLGYLAAYSGQIADRADWPGFVPAVFDYLKPDGYFKRQETCISDISKQIDRLRQAPAYTCLCQRMARLQEEAAKAIGREAALMRMAKEQRDRRRQEGYISASEQADMIRESQYRKGQLRRTRQRYREQTTALQQEIGRMETEIQALQQQRKELSDQLQHCLFDQFCLYNAQGEQHTLTEIFAPTAQQVPPSGAGECCEPKLLQYAYLHHLRPLQMAMVWHGASPRQEIRHHGQYYPSCRGKCKPILEWMLGKSGSEEHLPTGNTNGQEPTLSVLYSDSHVAVVCKPAGLLSVPGRNKQPSVYSLAHRQWPEASGPLIVHRLDMDTSGLLIIAKTPDAHRHLQEQFRTHAIQKQYTALLDPAYAESMPPLPAQGRITLPLRPDPLNRPYQVVDHERGYAAETSYEVVADGADGIRIHLYPRTGRTHQLRVHCAHPDGLGRPIKGDRLYGQRADRLYLHAGRIAFTHPATGQPMVFECPPDF